MSTSESTTKPFFHHLVYKGQKGSELILGIDGREHDRAIVRQVQCFVLVHPPVRAIAEDAAIDRDAGNVVGAHGFDKCLVKWLVFPVVCLININAHHLRFALNLQVRRKDRIFGLETWAGFAKVVS